MSKSQDQDARTMLSGIVAAAAQVRETRERVCAPFGITAAQYDVLRILRDGPADGMARREIIRLLPERSPDCTRLIDRLEKQGLVQRDRTTTDRRLSLTRLTTKGLGLAERLNQEICNTEEAFLSKLTPVEREQLLLFLRKLMVHHKGTKS